MLERFVGEEGQPALIDALRGQKMVRGDADLAGKIASVATCMELAVGDTLFEQSSDGTEIYFLLAGVVEVVINGRRIALRAAGTHVGEMASIQPAQKRSATIRATEVTVVAKLGSKDFHELARQNPEMYRLIAQDLAQRLLERNKSVGAYRKNIRVFIISSAEALPIARAVQNAFAHDPFTVYLWTDNVFRVSSYTLSSLEKQIDDSDFAIAIAHADDQTESRGKDWPSPRDNVIFELGLFMGRLGLDRAVLMEPREEKVKLPSDMAGVTTIPYRYQPGADAAAVLAPACNVLRDHINQHGPYNG